MKLFFNILFFWYIIIQNSVSAQTQMELLQADVLEGDVINGEQAKILTGSVIFKNNTTLVYCNKAIQFSNPSRVIASENVKIVDENKAEVQSDSLYYDGTTKLARLRKNITAKDQKMTLTTNFLDYEMNTGNSVYYKGGTVMDDKNKLNSVKGYYNAKTKIITFKKEVHLQATDHTIDADTLKYNYDTKVVYFLGPTYITQDSLRMFTTRGYNNTVTDYSYFDEPSRIEDKDYTLFADTLSYDKISGAGNAFSHLKLISKEKDLIVLGDEGIYNKINEKMKVYENALIKQVMDTDTVYIRADTLLCLPDSNDKVKIFCYNHVKIYKSDLQALCDSLVFMTRDSLIRFHKKPVIWAQYSQMTADTIFAQVKNKTLDYIDMLDNSYIISLDELKNLNQLKGKKTRAYFIDNHINRMLVNGNAQSIFYINEDKKKYTKGLNNALASEIFLTFEKNKPKTIVYRNKPEARFIPMHEVKEEDTRFKGFIWRLNERPELKDVVDKR